MAAKGNIGTLIKADRYRIPLYSSAVQAGFPSPADDHVERTLDLNKHLIKHPAATFFVRATGDSMTGAGIHSGDILVVDRSLEPKHGRVVIAAIDGALTVKRLHKSPGSVFLMPENEKRQAKYQSIKLDEESNTVIWGVVTCVLHEV